MTRKEVVLFRRGEDVVIVRSESGFPADAKDRFREYLRKIELGASYHELEAILYGETVFLDPLGLAEACPTKGGEA